MGVASGKGSGRSSGPTPAVVGIARSMRARDVSKPRTEAKEKAKDKHTDKHKDRQDGSGGSSPVDS
jgi:hypothetical protein